jgi:MFS family permease
MVKKKKSSSIIANQQFKEYMGTLEANGEYTIDTSKTGGAALLPGPPYSSRPALRSLTMTFFLLPPSIAIVSVFAGGALIGALLSGYLADKISRKRTILVGGIIGFVGGAIQGGAKNLEMM